MFIGHCKVWPFVTESVLVGWHPPWLVLLSIQINGVDMTEARHDQAVALLTGTSPTISLLVERDPKAPMGSPGQSRARAHSPPPPAPSDSPDQEEEGLSLHGNHLSQMEDEYPIEVRPLSDDFSIWVRWLFSLIRLCCRNFIKAFSVIFCSFGPCLVLNAVQFQRRWCMVWRLGLI